MEKIKTHILCSIIFFFRTWCHLWDHFEKYGGSRRATMTSQYGAYELMLDKQGYMPARVCAHPSSRANAHWWQNKRSRIYESYLIPNSNWLPVEFELRITAEEKSNQRHWRVGLVVSSKPMLLFLQVKFWVQLHPSFQSLFTATHSVKLWFISMPLNDQNV